MKASQFGAVVVALSGLLTFAAHGADAEAGRTKSASCAACHGADGNSPNGAWPSLAGQNANYLVKQLQDFKAGRRQNAQMSPMAAPLSDEDMRDLAAFYESQPIAAAAFDVDLIDTGEAIYRGGITETHVAACMGCHSPSGLGNAPAGWPSLAGQHPEYVVAQLNAFKHGERVNDAGRMMRNVTARMSEEEMAAVAAYIAGIR